MKTILLKQIRDRENDPEAATNAQLRADASFKKLRSMGVNMNALAKRVLEEDLPRKKLDAMRVMTHILAESMKDAAACKPGCSQCCHIPVAITQIEADLIGRQIGINAEIPVYTPEGIDMIDIGEPCRFLKDNQCSIYDSRPIACRLHYLMDFDSLLCTLVPGEDIEAPYFDGSQYQLLWMRAIGLNEAAKMARLSDFFPAKEGE